MKMLAISSGGGHWTELLRLRPAFDGADVTYVTVRPSYAADVAGSTFYVIPDASRWSKLKLLLVAAKLLLILLRVRPDVVVTTGSSPGYIALRLAKLMRCRTVWIDSFANSEELSMSGQMAGRVADLWLTQWPHLSADGGPDCCGSVF